MVQNPFLPRTCKLAKHMHSLPHSTKLTFTYSKHYYFSIPGQSVVLQLVDWVFRGVAQVIFVNNRLSHVSLSSHNITGKKKSGNYVPAGRQSLLSYTMRPLSHGKLCLGVLPFSFLPFNILVCLHIAATGVSHPYFPQVTTLLLSVPVGVGQVYGCDSRWTGGLFLLALLLCSPATCLHATLGSAVLVSTAISSHRNVKNIMPAEASIGDCVLLCSAVQVFFAAFFCAYMTSAISKFALPVRTWPFCLSTLIFVLVSTKIPAICRLPPSVVSHPKENRHCYRQLEASEGEKDTRQHSSQEKALLVRSF
uniref:Uncharacterized protein n=1 Tax=Myripristis murdjan TaxID=586833 RepID=A0A667Z741_9TELE